MAFSCFFSTVINTSRGSKIWKLERSNGAEWTVEQEWSLNSRPNAFLPEYPQIHEIILRLKKISGYWAEVLIFQEDVAKKIVFRCQDISENKEIRFSYEEYRKCFIETPQTRTLQYGGFAILPVTPISFPILFKCKISVYPCFPLTPELEPVPLKERENVAATVKPVKTEKAFRKLAEDMRSLLMKGTLADVVLVCGKQEIKAHKNILSARSEVFEKMFSLPMKENLENKVSILDISFTVLQELISYLYTGNITFKESSVVRELYMAADRYAVDELKELCSSWLKDMTLDNVLDVLILAETYSDKNMRNGALKFISENYGQLKLKETWNSFLKEYPSLTIEILSHVIDSPRTKAI